MNKYHKIIDNMLDDMRVEGGKTTTGDVFDLRRLADKETPMNPKKVTTDIACCPNCNETFYIGVNYCQSCGQKFDWSDYGE